jgi:hypothetical protein
MPIRKTTLATMIQPKLKQANWIGSISRFEAIHSSLMRELNIDPKLVADQQGHTLTNMNVIPRHRLKAALRR